MPFLRRLLKIIKVFFCVKHKQGFGSAEFQDYWRNHHTRLVPGMPELDRYVQCRVLLEMSASYDGAGELWCKDVAAFVRCWSWPELVKEQLLDTLKLVDAMLLAEKWSASTVVELWCRNRKDEQGENLLDEIIGLDLKGRNLRHAVLEGSVLIKVDLRGTRLQGPGLVGVLTEDTVFRLTDWRAK